MLAFKAPDTQQWLQSQQFPNPGLGGEALLDSRIQASNQDGILLEAWDVSILLNGAILMPIMELFASVIQTSVVCKGLVSLFYLFL